MSLKQMRLKRKPDILSVKLAWKKIASLGTALGLLTLFASSAMANFLTCAQVSVTPECNTYFISVSGTALDQPNAFVSFSFTITPTNLTVTGSIPVGPNDAAGDFSAFQVNSLGENFPPGGNDIGYGNPICQ
jgi:hypothetical protein